jgi:hypothetical protein
MLVRARVKILRIVFAAVVFLLAVEMIFNGVTEKL